MNRYLQDIFEQPDALSGTLEHFRGAGREELQRAAELVRGAARLVVTSMGSAYLSGLPLAHELSKVHPNVRLSETAELLSDAPFASDTLYLLLSRSGESGEVAAFAQRVKSSGGRALSITMTPSSTMARHSDFVLSVPVSYDGFICTKAYTGLMLAGLLLAAQTRDALEDSLFDALGENVETMRAEMEPLSQRIGALSWLREVSFVYFLSSGAGMSNAQSGALLMEEGARLPSASYSFRAFQHGPLEVVDWAFAGVWLDLEPTAETRELRQQLQQKTSRLLIASADDDAFSVTNLQSVPLSFRAMFAAPSVQLLAYHAGIARGLNPGEMRYLDWVVK